MHPPIEEPPTPPHVDSPTAWAESLAHFKALSVAERSPDRLVLGADTIVVVGGEIFGKPSDEADARRMLTRQAGVPSVVITGVCLMRIGRSPLRRIAHAETRVWMREAPEEREAYLAGGAWQGKAGAYGLQDVGDRLVERIEGSFSSVVGLPLDLVARMLEWSREQA